MCQPTGLLRTDEVANVVYALLLNEWGGLTRVQIVQALPQFYSTWVYAAINFLISEGMIKTLMDGAPEFYPTVMPRSFDYEL